MTPSPPKPCRSSRCGEPYPAGVGGQLQQGVPTPIQGWFGQRDQFQIERDRVVPNCRGPDSISLGLPPLYTRFTDVYDALERLHHLVERGGIASFKRPGCA